MRLRQVRIQILVWHPAKGGLIFCIKIQFVASDQVMFFFHSMLLCICRGLVVFQSIIEYHNKSNEAPRWAGIMKKSEGRTSCDILPLKTLHPLVDFYMNFVGSQYNICQKVYRFESVTQRPQLDAAIPFSYVHLFDHYLWMEEVVEGCSEPRRRNSQKQE